MTCGPRTAARDARCSARRPRQFDLAGYELLETPIFEDTELFARGVGQSTDIVQKEMFSFEDQGGRSITLRPEGTAGACRAYIEHGMHKLPQPVRCWYSGPFFRYESPQAGRFRQFSQIGAESIGSDDPSVDAELILLLADILAIAGCGGVELRLSSLGTPETRRAYADELRAYLRAREGELSEEVRRRLDSNPLRAFDSDHEGTRRVLADAPRLIDRLNDEDAAHLAAVRALLDDAGLAYAARRHPRARARLLHPHGVRVLHDRALGAQSALGGGGRYDGLVEQLGGPADTRPSAGPRASSGSCSRPASRLLLRHRAFTSCSTKGPTAERRSASCGLCARPGSPRRATRRAARSRAS